MCIQSHTIMCHWVVRTHGNQTHTNLRTSYTPNTLLARDFSHTKFYMLMIIQWDLYLQLPIPDLRCLKGKPWQIIIAFSSLKLFYSSILCQLFLLKVALFLFYHWSKRRSNCFLSYLFRESGTVVSTIERSKNVTSLSGPLKLLCS